MSEKFVKFLCMELSRICELFLWFVMVELVVVVLVVVVLVVLVLLLLLAEFVVAFVLLCVMFWPQTGDLSRFRTSINSSSIWLQFRWSGRLMVKRGVVVFWWWRWM